MLVNGRLAVVDLFFQIDEFLLSSLFLGRSVTAFAKLIHVIAAVVAIVSVASACVAIVSSADIRRFA